MNKEKIWLSSPHMGGGEQRYIKEAFDANWIAPLGPNVTEFEKTIETYLGEPVYVAALSSGTAAIHLGLILLGVESGDEVICQSMTFSASANPIRYLGANPVFIDSEYDTWNLCPQALEEAILNRLNAGVKPKAIIAVHLYGVPYKIDEVHRIAEKYQIPILEDSAEALGSRYKGKNCSTFGDIGILSFNGNKIITTSGGGALVAKDKKTKDRAIFFSTQSRDEAPHYQHSEIGFNYRMSNICAGIGRGQMEVLDSHVEARRSVNTFYQELFQDSKDVKLYKVPSEDYYSNCWLSAITFDSASKLNREGLRLFLEQRNIECRPLWKPMHLQPVFRDYQYFGANVSEDLFNRGLCLPSGSNLSASELERIGSAIKEYLKN